MLRAARHKDRGASRQSGDDAANRRTDMPRRGDICVDKDGVAMTQDKRSGNAVMSAGRASASAIQDVGQLLGKQVSPAPG